MGKMIPFPEKMRRRNADWNRGYSDAYRQLPNDQPGNEHYTAGHTMGASDRKEDDEAMQTGDFDLLTEEERKEVYGDEDDRV